MTEADSHSHPAGPSILARQLAWPSTPDTPVAKGLNLTLTPGLHLVLGGEGRGKTSLLRLLAGVLPPSSGQLERRVASQAWPEPLDPAADARRASDWLAGEQGRHARWDAGFADGLLAAWALEPHLGKQMHMLSAGTRRKLGLLAAAASGAELVLLDTPFAALDAVSRRVLLDVLSDAATQRQQIWVLADYAPPAGLGESLFATRIDLGD